MPQQYRHCLGRQYRKSRRAPHGSKKSPRDPDSSCLVALHLQGTVPICAQQWHIPSHLHFSSGERERESERKLRTSSFFYKHYKPVYSIGQKSHPNSQNLVTRPCLVSYKKGWGSVGSGWGTSQLSGSSQPKRTRKEGALEVINSLCHSLPASIQVSLLTPLPIGGHTFFLLKGDKAKCIQLLYPDENAVSLGEIQPLYQFRCGSGELCIKRQVIYYTILSWKGQNGKYLAESSS